MNNIIKHKQNISFFAKIAATLFLFFGLASVCAGQEPPPRLVVKFVPDPLFGVENGATNFLPGDSVTGTITVTNNSGATQKIITEAISETGDIVGLGSVLDLRIFEASVASDYYDNTLGYFLSSAGEVDLSILDDTVTTTYIYEVTFAEEVEKYQKETLGFNICIGFFDAEGRVCGDTVIGDEDETNDQSDDNNVFVSGASGYIPTPQLSLWGEHISWSGADGSGFGAVTIEWDTNLLATSKVVYGLSKDDDKNPIIYTLDLNDANFGYTLGTDENTPKTKDHLVDIDGLLPNREYKYRVVSRASPPTISYEHTFFIEMEVGELDEESDETEELSLAGGDGTTQTGGLDESNANTGGGTSEEGDSEPASARGYGEAKEDNFDSAGTEKSDKNFLSFLGNTADFFKSILSGGKIIAINVNPNQTGSDPNPPAVDGQDRSGNLASVLSAFLNDGSGIGKIICILLLLLLLFIIWRTMVKRLKNKQDVV